MPPSGLIASPCLGTEYGVGTGLFSRCLAKADWKVDSSVSRRSKISSTLSTEIAIRLPNQYNPTTDSYNNLLALIAFIAILTLRVIRFLTKGTNRLSTITFSLPVTSISIVYNTQRLGVYLFLQ